MPPDLPGNVATSIHVVEALLFLEGVHACPEAFVTVACKLPLCNQSLKGCFDQLLATLHVVEDVALEDKVAAVDKGARLANVLQSLDRAIMLHIDDVEGLAGTHA